MKKNCLVLIFIFLLANAPLAQTNTTNLQGNSLVIEEVIIRRNQRIPQSVIQSVIKTKKGRKYNLEQLDKDTKALFNTGYFDDVRCFSEGGSEGGKVITFELVEKPLISEVIYEGLDLAGQAEVVAELSRQKLQPIKGDEYSPVQCKRAVASIRTFFIGKGYQNAVVDCFVENVEQNEVKISFKVTL